MWGQKVPDQACSWPPEQVFGTAIIGNTYWNSRDPESALWEVDGALAKRVCSRFVPARPQCLFCGRQWADPYDRRQRSGPERHLAFLP